MSDRAWAGAHLCRLGCGRCGSGGQAPGRGRARRERSCSPPPQETLQVLQGPQEPHSPGPGAGGHLLALKDARATRVLGTRVGS